MNAACHWRSSRQFIASHRKRSRMWPVTARRGAWGLSLVYNGDSLHLSLSDNGRGFDMNAKPNGMGLRSIRERVGSVRGTAQIQSAPGQGTRIIVQVPTKS